MRPKRRTRLRLTLLAVVALLFQQTALAAYVCSVADMPAGNAAMAMHCEDIPMAQAEQSPALCSAHCTLQPVTTPNVHAPTVPPLLMPALLPASSLTFAALPDASTQNARAAVWRLSGIPPALRFRVLLI
ncbi:MAG TPA: hypothetical protein VFP92_08335 [Rhodanobacteraceae bacterium]|nr:hypothetical protein [Rhodanobacteraceae bacterium]